MKTQKTQKDLKSCLESLSRFTKKDLLDEIEQLLLSKAEKGEDLEVLKHFYQLGGLRLLK